MIEKNNDNSNEVSQVYMYRMVFITIFAYFLIFSGFSYFLTRKALIDLIFNGNIGLILLIVGLLSLGLILLDLLLNLFINSKNFLVLMLGFSGGNFIVGLFLILPKFFGLT